MTHGQPAGVGGSRRVWLSSLVARGREGGGARTPTTLPLRSRREGAASERTAFQRTGGDAGAVQLAVSATVEMRRLPPPSLQLLPTPPPLDRQNLPSPFPTSSAVDSPAVHELPRQLLPSPHQASNDPPSTEADDVPSRAPELPAAGARTRTSSSTGLPPSHPPHLPRRTVTSARSAVQAGSFLLSQKRLRSRSIDGEARSCWRRAWEVESLQAWMKVR